MDNLDFKSLFNEKEIVILDSCTKKSKYSYPKYFSSVLDYSCLDGRVLDEFYEEFSQFAEDLRHPNVRTIPEVSEELRQPVKSLQCMSRKIKNKGGSSQKRATLDIQMKLAEQSVTALYDLSKVSELDLLDPRYECLVDIFKNIESHFNFKRKNKTPQNELSLVKRPRAYHGPRLSKDTDERLIAATLYLLMFSDKSPVLVSRDHDFIKLIQEGFGIFGSRTFLPYNAGFEKALERNGFEFYFCSQTSDMHLAATKDHIRWWSKHRIYSDLQEGGDEFINDTIQLWKRLNSYPSFKADASCNKLKISA